MLAAENASPDIGDNADTSTSTNPSSFGSKVLGTAILGFSIYGVVQAGRWTYGMVRGKEFRMNRHSEKASKLREKIAKAKAASTQ